MKPRNTDNAKATLMVEFWNQAEFDLRMIATNDERGPGYNYYYHDDMDHLVRLPVKYLTTGHVDPKAPGGYRDNYVAKGYRVIADQELMSIIRRQQADKYTKIGIAPPWADKQQEARRAK